MRFVQRASLGLSLLVTGIGCGDDGTGGAGGQAATSGSTSKASGSGTPTSSGSGNASSASGTTTATGSATTVSASDASSSSSAMCPDVLCASPCPMGYWDELDGCQSCACEATLSFVQDSNGLETQYIKVSVQAAPVIGGIDRWELRFDFDYDNPAASDDAQQILATVRLPVVDLMTEPGMANEMRIPMGGMGEALELMGGEWSLFGFAVFMEELTIDDGFVSIRRNGQVFEGFVSLDFHSNETPKTFHASGPFTTPVPPI